MKMAKVQTLEIINEVNKLLIERYIFKDVAEEIEKNLMLEYDNGTFNDIDDVVSLAREITKILAKVSNDGHLHLYKEHSQLEMLIAKRNQSQEEIQKLKQDRINNERNSNFGFHKIEILEGNIGYLDLRCFCQVDYASEVASSAVKFLANTNAIIVDLRYNGGGETEMVILLASYLLGERVLFNTCENRYENFTEQYWTHVCSPGKVLKEKDVYILVDGKRTFSAAEDFAYGMQQLNRATVIGETTRGGGHPIDLFSIIDLLILQLPIARAINPITKTNWEKVGVKPDVLISSEIALDKAYEMCLEKLISKEQDQEKRMFLEFSLARFSARNKEIKIQQNLLNKYTGKFGRWMIVLEGEYLYLKEKSGQLNKLIPKSNNIFTFEDELLSHIGLLYQNDSNTGELYLHCLYTHSREIRSKAKSNKD